MEVNIHWRGGISFEGKTESGHSVVMDAEPIHGGKEAGPRPMELLLLGLGGCTAMDVVSILKKSRCKLDRLDVKVQADRADQHPKVFTHFRLEYLVAGQQIDEQQVQRAIELSQERYCSASVMLRKSGPIEYSWKIENR